MEVTKKRYFQSFTQRVGEDTIEEMRKTIQAEEKNIRASYDETAYWIPSEYYVELIFLDSVFIMEFTLRVMRRECSDEYSDDKIVDHSAMVMHDLILLENQFPYFIFDSLFSSSMKELYLSETIDQVILSFFGLTIEEKRNFKHFTDMFRCVYEASFDDIPNQMIEFPWKWPPIREFWNADALSQAGVDFKEESVVEERRFFEDYGLGRVTKSFRGLSLHVKFEKGCLRMPDFFADEVSDMYLRNVIAFEQCHDAAIPFTSNYIYFLNYLITSSRDAQLLIEEGVVKYTMGGPSFVVDMVTKLQIGLNVENSSQYHYVAMNLKAHYKSRRKISCWATLRKVGYSSQYHHVAMDLMDLSKTKVREPCIYRVPRRIRNVKPEAYTPRMVVIGPLHRSRKSTAKDGAETRSNPWYVKHKTYTQANIYVHVH